MKELIVQIKGEVTKSNFPEWEKELIYKIESANKVLKTDDDFAEAETFVKQLAKAEKELLSAKNSAIEQAEEFNKLFAAFDKVDSVSRNARLILQSQIKIRKSEIKADLVKYYEEQAAELLECQTNDYKMGAAKLYSNKELTDAIKSKHTVNSMTAALDELLEDINLRVENENKRIELCRKLIDAIHEDDKPLFQDESYLLSLQGSDLVDLINERINKAKEAARLKAQREAKEKLESEQRKLDAQRKLEQQAKIKAEESKPIEQPKQADRYVMPESKTIETKPSIPEIGAQKEKFKICITLESTIGEAKIIARSVDDVVSQYVENKEMSLSKVK